MRVRRGASGVGRGPPAPARGVTAGVLVSLGWEDRRKGDLRSGGPWGAEALAERTGGSRRRSSLGGGVAPRGPNAGSARGLRGGAGASRPRPWRDRRCSGVPRLGGSPKRRPSVGRSVGRGGPRRTNRGVATPFLAWGRGSPPRTECGFGAGPPGWGGGLPPPPVA